MGERTLLKLKDGNKSILLYLHWYNPKDCLKAVKETMWKSERNNLKELAKFVVYFIQDHEETASIYVVPREMKSYGETYKRTIDITKVRESTNRDIKERLRC